MEGRQHIAKEELPKGAGLMVKLKNGQWRRELLGRRNTHWVMTDRQWMNLSIKQRNPSPYELVMGQNEYEGQARITV